ncbi:helix-loop-helix domain-containing protein [Endozoicomonas atrinae]|uniref:helix-loop-helix domain-containing protein n=1 Tax=Endozoicomonas atrinae TaxID=1333660 RepID=UPI0008266956|nr:helix-loop-helix domain-containing protein [Endozoicomonas atrinae]
MNINTTQMQQYQTQLDEPYGACGINPAEGGTFNQFDVHQMDHQSKYSMSTTEVSSPPLPKRQRTLTAEQREEATAREKKRNATMNKAFQELKNKIPGGSETKLPKIQILKQATEYIKELDRQLGFAPDPSNSIDQITKQK